AVRHDLTSLPARDRGQQDDSHNDWTYETGSAHPDWSLGRLINENQTAFATRPWLFWWPGVFIVAIALTINFIGDGLRDAFDPRQRKFNPKRARETGAARGAAPAASPQAAQ
ncbi:hypothetical protein VBH63_07080, partial [Kocuria rhizophila]